MSKDIMLWFDWLGGADVFYLIGFTIAVVQLLKPIIPNKHKAYTIRSLSILIGAFAGLIQIDFSSKGAMVGVACGAGSAFLWFVISTRLEVGSWIKAAPIIAARMKGHGNTD